MALRDMYKKHHWQVSGPTFYQLHLLFDKHYDEQVALVDLLAERVQLLGGLSIAMAHDVAEMTRLERPPRGREDVPVQISRLLEGHELILKLAHDVAKRADDAGDDGTNDLVVSDVIRTNELQVWFLAEHLVETPISVAAKGRFKLRENVVVSEGVRAYGYTRPELGKVRAGLVSSPALTRMAWVFVAAFCQNAEPKSTPFAVSSDGTEQAQTFPSSGLVYP